MPKKSKTIESYHAINDRGRYRFNNDLEHVARRGNLRVQIECNGQVDLEAAYATISEALCKVERELRVRSKEAVTVLIQDVEPIPCYYRYQDLTHVVVLHKANLAHGVSNQNLLHELVHCLVYNRFSRLLSEGLAVYVSQILTDRPIYPTRLKNLRAALDSIRGPQLSWAFLIANEKSKPLFLLSNSSRRLTRNAYIQSGVLVQELVRSFGIENVVEYIRNLRGDLKLEEFTRRFGKEIDISLFSKD